MVIYEKHKAWVKLWARIIKWVPYFLLIALAIGTIAYAKAETESSWLYIGVSISGPGVESVQFSEINWFINNNDKWLNNLNFRWSVWVEARYMHLRQEISTFVIRWKVSRVLQRLNCCTPMFCAK